MFHRCLNVAAALLFCTMFATVARADEVAAPEIAISSMAGGVALLTAAGVFVADRIRRKPRAK